MKLDMDQVLREELAGEKISWSGRPLLKNNMLTWDIFLFPLLGLFIISVFYFLNKLDPVFFGREIRFIQIIGGILAFFMIISPYLKYRRLGKTIYAVTDQSCVVLVGRKKEIYKKIEGKFLVKTKNDGSGDVLFINKMEKYTSHKFGGKKTVTTTTKNGFWGIPNAQVVGEQVKTVLK
jgi:hypothetical protein